MARCRIRRIRARLVLLSWRLRGSSGQATVEFAIVTAAFICIALAFGALWDVLKDGVLVEHAVASASHHVAEGALGNIADVFLY